MIFFKRQPLHIPFLPKRYALFNVEVFNSWFNDSENTAIYANSGIFLRLDKLSNSHIEDYLLKCHNVVASEWDLHEDICKFYEEIRKDWLEKLDKR